MNPNFFNLSRRKKRNILSELLLGKSNEGIISKKGLNAVHRLIAGMPSSKARIETNYQPAMTKNVTIAQKKPPTTKKKSPHYLSQDFSESLDRAPEGYPFTFACKFYDSGCSLVLHCGSSLIKKNYEFC